MDIVRLENELVKKIADAANELEKLHPENRQEIISIGRTLESIKSQIPGDFIELIAYFIMCLEGLQALYNQLVEKPDVLAKAEAKGLEDIASMLETGDNSKIEFSILFNGHQLWVALDREPEQSPYRFETDKLLAGQNPELILNDVAAMIIQMGSSDTDELEKIQKSLEQVQVNNTLSVEIRDIVKLINSKIHVLIKEQPTNADDIFKEINELLEQTLDIMEGIQLTPNEKKAVSIKTDHDNQSDSDENQEYHLPSDFDTDIINEFVAESNEYLEDAESALLQLENNPKDTEAINVVFRAFHTIKGTSGFLQLTLCSQFAHAAESFFSKIREGEIECTGANADLSLRSIDMVKGLIHTVENGLTGTPMRKPAGYNQILSDLENQDASSNLQSEPVIAEIKKQTAPVKSAPVKPQETSPTLAPQTPAKITLSDNQSQETEKTVERIVPQAQTEISASGKDPFVRVRTDRLDELIEMVGELVIAQSMIAQDKTVINESRDDFARKVTHANKIVRELQDISMSMRMIPLSGTFQKMSRLVRDLSMKTGKRVNFVLQGEETEIDRKMVELIKDPIVHMIRNAVDHGLESTDDRVAKGKPKEGTLKLSAFHSSGNVIIQIQDDGKGLDRDKILNKAIEKGIIDSDRNLTDNEVYNLIFAPGFSTADKVTDVSGRGVGLDVVKRNIEELRGKIETATVPGQGCSFSLCFPLTIAIIDGMLVKIGEERYIVPIIDIHMSFRPKKDVLFTVAERGEMVMFQGSLIPIFRLHNLFSIQEGVVDPTKGLLVVVGEGERRCALLVDQLLGQQQVVTKSLGEDMTDIKGISGGAILGDGRVGLILDTSELSTLARETAYIKINYTKN